MTMLPEDIRRLATNVVTLAQAQGIKLVTAESCTGGLVAGSITSVPGSSDVFDQGFVVYANEVKRNQLGVPADLLEKYGAVSELCAAAMAEGALAIAQADIAVSVTGIAGPGGGTPDKPVGLVYLAVARRDRGNRTKRYVFAGTREDVRHASVNAALDLVHETLRIQ